MRPCVRLYTHLLQLFFRCLSGEALQEIIVDEPDDFGLLRLDDQMVVLPAVAVNREASVGDTLLETLSGAPFHVLREAPDFLLCEGSQQGQHDLAVTAEGIDAFLLEPNLDAQFLQVPDGLQQVNSVSGKAGDALGEDDVYLPGLAVVEHPLELLSAGRLGAGHRIVRIDACVLPFGIALNQIAIIADLC